LPVTETYLRLFLWKQPADARKKYQFSHDPHGKVSNSTLFFIIKTEFDYSFHTI
jgi:hypothetical protein